MVQLTGQQFSVEMSFWGLSPQNFDTSFAQLALKENIGHILLSIFGKM